MSAQAPVNPEDQRAGALDCEHEDHRARQDLQDGLGAGQPERRADGQPIHERDPASQQAYGQHQGDEKAQTAHLHQQQDDPLAQPGEIGAGGEDGQTGDGRGRGRGEQRVHEGDGPRRHPRQQQQRGAETDQRRQRHHQPDRDRHAALPVRVEALLDQPIDAGTAAFSRSGVMAGTRPPGASPAGRRRTACRPPPAWFRRPDRG